MSPEILVINITRHPAERLNTYNQSNWIFTIFSIFSITTMGANPTADQFNDLIRAFAVCTAALYANYFYTQMAAVDYGDHPSEDKLEDKLIPADDAEQQAVLKRKKRTFANGQENIPIHLAIFGMAFIIQSTLNAQPNKGKHSTTALIFAYCMYTICRLMFTVCYVFSLQPFRTILFLLSQLMVMMALIIMCWDAFDYDYNDFA
jgi:uncharacterized MAPEG superfamily protein